MVSEEAPAAEEAPTKPLFTKIGYDNEVRRQQHSSQYVAGWANSSIMPRKNPLCKGAVTFLQLDQMVVSVRRNMVPSAR